MTTRTAHEIFVESGLRAELRVWEETVRNIRSKPPEGVRPELLALDLASFVKRRDELRDKLGIPKADRKD
ncbi:hypothetical protein [Methylobacterium pseudosasicola]|uniref:Uncharacterized protein n=1 Tax=Methylobacterium pseudosasicola TaxID=582667 RepID=A0A1I4NKK2_9HYPH|nr:hypothetical protein [Methylobacterium pseudosasicola]SFM16028.1 hypothetical protein SAMN05192568_102138 [Methylobacterium pseudosasicola]